MMVPPAPTSTEFPGGGIPGRLDVPREPCESSARRNEASQARAGGDDFRDHLGGIPGIAGSRSHRLALHPPGRRSAATARVVRSRSMVYRPDQPFLSAGAGRRSRLLPLSPGRTGPSGAARLAAGANGPLGGGTRRALRLVRRSVRSSRAGGAPHGAAGRHLCPDGAADPSSSVELDRGASRCSGNTDLEYRLARAVERHVPDSDPRRGGVALGPARDRKAAHVGAASRDAISVGILLPPDREPRHRGDHALPDAIPPRARRLLSRDGSCVDRGVRDLLVAHLRDTAADLLSDRDVQPSLVRERFARHPAQPFSRPARLRPGDAVRRLSGGPLLAVTAPFAVDHASAAQCAGSRGIDLPLRAMARRSQLWAPLPDAARSLARAARRAQPSRAARAARSSHADRAGRGGGAAGLQRARAGARDLCEGDVGMEQDSFRRRPAPGTGWGLPAPPAACGAPAVEIAPCSSRASSGRPPKRMASASAVSGTRGSSVRYSITWSARNSTD